MKRKDFWVTRLSDMEKFYKTIKAGKVKRIGRSAGGRPIYSISYGKKRAIKRTANYASAMQSRHPDAFFGRTGGRTKSIVMIAGVHGAEVEGMMGLINLTNILETGFDLAGNRHKTISNAAKGLRIVLVPLANPDGRERLPIDDLVGHPVKDIPRYGQGVWANGRIMKHPAMKRIHPMPPEKVKLLGGYFNDDGVNIQADCEFTNFMAKETKALLELTLEEVPEATANIHSCSLGPFVIYVKKSLPLPYDVRLAQVGEACHRKFLERKLRPANIYRHSTGDGTVTFDTLLHYLTGALPISCEGPHGTTDHPFTHEEILQVHLTFHEVWLTMLAEEGLRPSLPY